ncbi:MAG: retropepsin-like aspartic protease [Vitreimonas sp.]
MVNCKFLAFAIGLACCASTASAETVLQRVQHTPLGDTRVLDDWLTAHPRAPAGQRADAYGALCEIHGRASRYRAAAEACGRVVELQGRRASASSQQSLTFWRTLADVPAIEVRGDVDVPLTYGWSGMAEAPVQTGSISSSWGVDTGAEISTISASDAARFRARIIDAPVEVQGSTPGTAAGRIGVIDHLRLGGARVDNVPVLILPDSALTFDDHRVPPLLGAPILYAFGRVEFANHAQRLRLSAARASPLPGRLGWVDGGLTIEFGLSRGRVEAHLDTGANVSELNVSTRALLTGLERSRLTLSTGRLAGVSGQIQRRRWRSPPLGLSVGGGICRVDGLEFGDERAGAQGRVGIDLVKSCENFVFDVSTMTFSTRAD